MLFRSPGIIEAGLTIHASYKAGATMKAAVITGVISGVATAATIGNLAEKMGGPLDFATKVALDVSCGSGYSWGTSAINQSIVLSNQRQTVNTKKNVTTKKNTSVKKSTEKNVLLVKQPNPFEDIFFKPSTPRFGWNSLVPFYLRRAW